MNAACLTSHEGVSSSVVSATSAHRDRHRRGQAAPRIGDGCGVPPRRRVRLGEHHDAQLAYGALAMAVAMCGGQVPGVILHTDQDSEYTAGLFRAGPPAAGHSQSMGRPGSALDNAVIESWHSTLEFELRAVGRFATRAQARLRVAAWIEDYNYNRRHSACQMMSPVAYEQMLAAKEVPEMRPLLLPPMMRRCSAQSRSFLLGRPGQPAGPPPGQRLRSGALIGQRRTEAKTRSALPESPTVSGEPRTETRPGFAWPTCTGCQARCGLERPRH